MSTVSQQRKSVSQDLIQDRIEEAKRALWWSEVTRASLTLLIAGMTGLLVWLVIDHWVYSPGAILRTVLFLGVLLAVAFYLVRRWWPVVSSSVTDEYAAWSLEQDHQDYRQQLTSYVTLKQAGAPKGIRAKVVHAIGTRAATLLKTFDHLPNEATGTFRWWIAAAATFAILVVYLVASPKSSVASWKRLAMPLARLEPVRRVSILDVEPKATSALAGRTIDVSAVVEGLRDDELVYCRWFDAVNQRSSELTYDSADERFRGKLALGQGASGLVRYTIEAGDAVAGPFDISVEDVPVVAVQSIRYRPPAYTKQTETTSSSPAITALDGTDILISATTSRPVVRAELQFNCRDVRGVMEPTAGTLAMVVSDDGTTLTAERRLRKSAGTNLVELDNYRIKVWDAEDRSNPEPILYPINVIADLPPEIAIVVPTKSPVKVQLDAQQIIEVHAMDADFELERVSLELSRGLQAFNEPVLWQRQSGESGRGNQVSEFRFRPHEQGLKVGDKVQVTAIAVDNRLLDDDSSAKPNLAKTDVLEIWITEAAGADLPDDPSSSNGLSKPDDRPASDAEQSPQQQDPAKRDSEPQNDQQSGADQGSSQDGSKQETSGKERSSQNGDQGSGQESSGSDGSNQQGSNQQSAGQQGAGQQDSGQQGSEQQGSGQSNGEKNRGDASDQGGESRSGDANSNGEASADAKPSPGGQGQQNGSPQSDGQPAGESDLEDTDRPQQQEGQPQGGDGSNGAGGADPNQPPGRQDASEGSASRQPNAESNPSDSKGDSAASSDGQANDDSMQESSGANSRQSDQGAGNSAEQRSEGQGSERQRSDGGGQGADGSDSANRAPQNDGEAMERIKDYIERKREEQAKQGGGRSGNGDENSERPDKERGDGSSASQSPRGDKERGTGETQSDAQNPETSESAGDGMNDSGGNANEREGADSNANKQEESSQQGNDASKSVAAAAQKGSESGNSQDQGNSNEEGNPNDQGSSDSGDNPGSDGDATSSEKSNREDSASDTEAGQGERTRDDRKEQDAGGEQDSGTQAEDGSPSRPSGSQSPSQPSNRSNQASQQSSSASDGSGSGQETFEGDSSFEPPPPPDVEYSKEATDMVLDYLEETRDQVDEKLLDDLNWSKEDLRRFQKRWEKVRELDQPESPTSKSSEFEEALRSLGLNPESKASRMRESPSDGFQNLRDSGNRRRAPSAFRDAFEAFRGRSR
ncbi:MAG: hypothetical protein AAF802_15565 [Planctomycetota bacterium]